MKIINYVIIAADQDFPFGQEQLDWVTLQIKEMKAKSIVSVTEVGEDDVATYVAQKLGMGCLKIPPQPYHPDEGYYEDANQPTQEQLIAKTAQAVITLGQGELVQEMKRIAGNQWLTLVEFRNALLDAFDAGFDI